MFNRDLEFYSLETQGFDFCEILREINQKDNKSSNEGGKVLEENNFEVSLIEFKEDNDFCEGIIAKSNKEDLPLIGNIYSKILRILGLKKDEGIINMTYFSYIKHLKILTLLPARNGVKWGTFKSYIQSIHAIKQDFNLYPLLTKRIMEIYKKMGSITLIDAEIDIGNNSAPNSSLTQNSPLKDILANAKNAQASRIRLELYNEKLEGGLKLRPIRELVKSLIDLGIFYKPLSIKIKGSSDAEEKDIVIDLIKERYRLGIDLGDNSRYLVFDECSKKVRNAIKIHEKDIGELVE